MGIEFDFKIEIARRPPADAGTALSGKSYHLALAHTFRDADIHLPLAQMHLPVVAQFRPSQGDCTSRTTIGVLKIDQHFGMMILPASAKFAAGAAAPAAH